MQTSVVKEEPTGTDVHIDTAIGNGSKQRRKKILDTCEVCKMLLDKRKQSNNKV